MRILKCYKNNRLSKGEHLFGPAFINFLLLQLSYRTQTDHKVAPSNVNLNINTVETPIKSTFNVFPTVKYLFCDLAVILLDTTTYD